MTDDKAVALFHRLCDRYGWAGAVLVRDDVESVYR